MEVKIATIRRSRYYLSNRVADKDSRINEDAPPLEDPKTRYRFAPGPKAANLALGIRFLLRQFDGYVTQAAIEA